MKKNQVIISELMALCSILVVAIIMAAYSAKSNERKVAIVKVENLRNPVIEGMVKEITKPTVTNNEITNYEVQFPKSGNSIAYSFDVVNKGNKDVRINELVIDTPVCKQNNVTTDCSKILYSLFYSGSGYKVNYDDELKAGETKTIVLFIKTYTDNITVSNLNLKLSYK